MHIYQKVYMYYMVVCEVLNFFNNTYSSVIDYSTHIKVQYKIFHLQ